jgi:hypothetical protein
MYSKTGKGILITAVVAKVRKLDVLDIKLDYLRNNVDLSDDFEYNAIEVKMATLNYANMWSFSTEREQWYDNIFLVCMDKHQPWKTIEEIYIIPSDVAYKVKSITIYKGSQRSIYSTFKIDPKPYNDAYHSLMEFLKDKKYLCIEDIKKWLNDGK